MNDVQPGGGWPGDSAAIDGSGMGTAIARLGDQFETGWRMATNALRSCAAQPSEDMCGAPSAGVVVCGMGGSAIGADIVHACLPDLPVPYEVVRGYELPRWAASGVAVVAVSYSGETEETLSCLAQAAERGCRIVCVASGGQVARSATECSWPLARVPGGLQPRAALGYLVTAVAAAMEHLDLAYGWEEQIDETVTLLRGMAVEMGPEAANSPARRLAMSLRGLWPLVYGYGATAPSARRWKTQINENAKSPAVFAELPEADHNEIMSWSADPGRSAVARAVVLDDPAAPLMLARRADATAASLSAAGVAVDRFAARGASPLARACTAAYAGDWVSYYLALLSGVDPTPVPAIAELKARLAADASA